METPTTSDIYEVFADALVPEAFSQPSSAFRASVRAEPDGLDAWVRSAKADALSFRYPESGDFVHGTIIVQDAGVRWEWHYEPDHPLKWLVPSVREELSTFVSPWVFAAVVPGPRIGWVEREEEDGTFHEQLEIVTPTWRLPWYAEVRRPGLAMLGAGWDDYELEELQTSHVMDPERSLFGRDMTEILRGHPSRRRHRRQRSTG